ncbi:protein SGT1 homolog [Lycium barbarum]|uniref:protein SGT1 homolog n=1 Tax=Lycium barbarum TaxID=112863 RepID=UPI00293F6139|nr:protein SGT1 homolog [Lycium barbarum]
MASDLETRAKEAFIDDHFELAADLYTQAIAISPNNPELFADRAQANIKLNYFTEAVVDANKAIELDPSLSKAYLRKGLACMKLEEYQTAKTALEKGASLAPGESRFTKLIKECDERIAEEAGELPNQSVNKASANVSAPSASESSDNVAIAPKDAQPTVNLSSQGSSASESSDNVAIAPKDAQPTVNLSSQGSAAKPKYRHEFFQKPEEVVVTIFAKGIPAKNVVVDFGEQILSVSIDVPGEETYSLQPRLFSKITPAKCRYEVMSTKIEIRLAKAEPLHWTSLEYTREPVVVQRPNVSSVAPRPSYPTSKLRNVDWDRLEAEVKKEEKDEKLDGDAALNKFFRDIYQDADEDTRRAMMKSFVESNGTVLSTNWKEVGTKKVEGSPPDGMELKKWEI